MKSLGLYIHIPFCKSKCAYCDFHSRPDGKKNMVLYSRAVFKHIEEANMQHTNYEVDSIYFGGGTPTVLPIRELSLIVRAIYENFNVLENCEMTIEANPETVNLRLLKKLRSLGFNRISMGVQSSNDEELDELGRIHSFDDVTRAVELCREAKFNNISLDLMYGIPSQTMESYEASLTDIVNLAPEHISCYALKLEEGTRLAQCRDAYTFPDEDTVADMYLFTIDFLKKHGYEQYEISNFAKGGKFSRHNKKYWNMSEYLGFGPSAHSFLNKLRYSFVSNTEEYIQGVMTDGTIIDKKEDAQPVERAGEYIMLALRTTEGISASELERKYLTYFDELEKKLLEYHKLGLAEFDGINWSLTPRGFLVSNTIISELLIALEKSRGVVARPNIYNKIV